MTRFSLRAVAAGLLLSAAAPVLAQAAAPVAPVAPAGRMMRGGHGGMMHDRAFPSMSEAGRATMREAMAAGGDRKAEREAVKAARDRMLAILDAERLDSAALKRAMEEERNAANASRERHQTAMLAAFSKLSLADRKAFVADSRAMKARIETRMQEWRGKRGARGDVPPPPPSPGV